MEVTESINASYIKEVGKLQTVARTHIKCNGVRKVLSTSATSSVRVSEVLTGESRLAGRVTVDALVITDDGMSKESGWTDFTDRLEAEDISASTRMYAIGKVLDSEVVGSDNSEITLASVVEVTVYAEIASAIPPAPEAAENVYTNENRINLTRLITRFSGKAESKCGESVQYTRILSSDARACIHSAEANIDSVLVRGDVYIDGLGLTAEGVAQPFSVTSSFEEELSAEGARRDDFVNVRVISDYVTTEESESGLQIVVSTELSGEVYGELSAPCTIDAFSPHCELNLEKKSIKGISMKEHKYFTEQIEGVVTLPEGDNADKILALCGFTLSPIESYESYGKAVIEGAICGTVVYADIEAGRRSSYKVELPFRKTTDICVEEGDIITISGSVGKIMVKPSRAGEISMQCELTACISVAGEVSEDLVVGYSKGTEYEDKSGTISIHIGAGGESLWETAKDLLVTPELIISQNPELRFPLSKGDKVFVLK